MNDLKYALTLHQFEPQGIGDWLLIPWWIVRYLFAWCWFLTIFGFDKLRGHGTWSGLRGRREDVRPVICDRCLWAGPYKWLCHTYYSDGFDDVEPVSECPRCGEAL